MKKKIAATLILSAVSAAALAAAFRSYSDIGNKLNLDTGAQKTMKVKEEIQEENTAPQEQLLEDVISEPEVTEQPEVTVEPEETNPEAPVLTLKSEKVEIKAGSRFDVVAQVEDITDNKDDRSYLFRYIHVDGAYNTSVPGEYTLEYVVTDRDGNRSAPKNLQLIVTAE